MIYELELACYISETKNQRTVNTWRIQVISIVPRTLTSTTESYSLADTQCTPWQSQWRALTFGEAGERLLSVISVSGALLRLAAALTHGTGPVVGLEAVRTLFGTALQLPTLPALAPEAQVSVMIG